MLLVGCVGAVGLSAATVRWEGLLVRGNHTWLIDLGRHPVWDPPQPPEYERFRQTFEQDEDFPLPQGCTTRAAYDPAEVALAAMLYMWPVTGLCGLLYIVARGPRRDFVLHCAAWVAAGLAASVVSCVGLWCLAGGWGPPAAGCFAVLGIVAGMACGVVTFRRGSRAGTRESASSGSDQRV